jgi:transcriptional regulator with XRE-family HTH domain
MPYFRSIYAYLLTISRRIDVSRKMRSLGKNHESGRMTDHSDNGIGARLRALRMTKGLTLDRLAGICGLTRGYLSLVERGLKTPSIAALLRMTEALGADVGTLFNGRHDAAPNYVLYRHPASVEGTHTDVVPLAPGRAGKMMEPFITYPTTFAVQHATHSGDELIVVLRGEVIIRLGHEEMVLRPGDSLYFTASIEHSIRRIGAALAELLVVVSRPGGVSG